MQITRETIQDLLPLYLTEEVSMETRAMIDEYLETDIKLAKIVEKAQLVPQSAEFINSVELDDKMKTFRKAQRKMIQNHWFAQYYIFLGLSIFFTLAWIVTIFFEVSRMGFPTFVVASLCWVALINVSEHINKMAEK